MSPDVGQRLEPVTNAHVAQCAKLSCLTCKGSGKVTLRRTTGEKRVRLCVCAKQRFLKKHTTSVVQEISTGRLFWRPARGAV